MKDGWWHEFTTHIFVFICIRDFVFSSVMLLFLSVFDFQNCDILSQNHPTLYDLLVFLIVKWNSVHPYPLPFVEVTPVL